jgi:hypothetical protein
MKLKKILDAHRHSSNHRKELEKSKAIGCFYCKRIIKFSQIKEWIDKGQTGVCLCGIDSLIGDASGYKVNKDFLEEMYKYWFRIVK